MSQNNIRRFAITRELLTALSKASAVQKQAFAVFLNAFRMGKPFDYLPLVGASEYELIEISDDFSVVIKRNSEIHVLLWLGNLADVKQWAYTHKCEVNSVTGSLQIYQVAVTPTKATPLPTHDEVAIFEKLSDYRHMGKAKNYLYTIAGNLCRNEYKRQAGVPMEEESLARETAPGNDADAVIDRVMMEWAIAQLPQEQQEVIDLYYFREMKLREISAALHIGLPLVKYRLRRAKSRLQELLEKEELSDGSGQTDENL